MIALSEGLSPLPTVTVNCSSPNTSHISETTQIPPYFVCESFPSSPDDINFFYHIPHIPLFTFIFYFTLPLLAEYMFFFS